MSNLHKIQAWLKQNSIDVFIVPRTDEFLNEYIAPNAERLKWISNFSGSAGKAIIMQTKAYIFVDGRYTIQVQNEVDSNNFSIEPLDQIERWLKNNLKNKFVLGIDPRLHSIKEIKSIKKITCAIKAKIKFLSNNPIDLLWKNRPRQPFSKAFEHKLKYSGRTVINKISYIKSILHRFKCEYYILTSLDSIAWLLNLRGNDILYTPLNFAYVLLTPYKKIELFINEKKLKK